MIFWDDMFPNFAGIGWWERKSVDSYYECSQRMLRRILCISLVCQCTRMRSLEFKEETLTDYEKE